ncbi:MAG: O-antigen ligase domain-containing protein, partial [Candidatus Dadabacteria bacterium]
LLYTFDSASYFSIIKDNGLMLLLKSFSQSPPEWLSVSEVAFRYLIIFQLAVYFFDNSAARRACIQGLVYALPCLFLILIFQILGVGFPNQNAYWNFLGRLPASLSDPNSFGLSSFLVALIFFNEEDKKPFQTVVILILLLLACVYSGSRTLWLGVVLMAGIIALRSFKGSLYLLVIASAILVIPLLYYLGVSNHLQAGFCTGLPSGLERLCKAMLVEDLSTTFHSRIIFNWIAAHVFLENPFVGIGPGRFRALLPYYAASYYPQLGIWTDNPNNFYLGILVETGLIGAVLLTVTIFNFKLKDAAKRSIFKSSALWTYGLLLLTGPHVEFVEVSLLTAILFAQTLTLRETNQFLIHRNYTYIIGVVILFIAVNFRNGNTLHGLYPPEQTPQKDYVVWTARKALFKLRCRENASARLSIRSLVNTPVNKALKIFVSTPLEKRTIAVSDKLLHQLKLSCIPAGGAVKLSKLPVEIKLKQVWLPAVSGTSSDYRRLGVQLVIGSLSEITP